MSGPLEGVVVVDLTQQLAGPGGTMLLGDMGADVLRVDPPPDKAMADNMVGPLPGETGRRRVDLVVGRSKRSISLDLTKPEAREIVYELAKRADVVAQNYRPGVAEKLGMDADSFRRVNPDVIYSRISVFGDRGPDRSRVGFDIIAQGAAGTMVSFNPEGPPAPLPVPIADVTGFCLETIGILAALYHRKVSGEAQKVSTSMLAGALLENILRLVQVEGIDQEWRRATVDGARAMIEGGATWRDVLGATNTGIGGQAAVVSDTSAGALGGLVGIFYGVHRTKDGYIVVGALNLRQQRRMNEALGLNDPRFEPGATAESITSPDSIARFEKMQSIAQDAFAGRTTTEMLEHLQAYDIACGPVMNTLEVFESEHHLAEQVIIEAEDVVHGPLRTLGFPIQFEKTPMRMAHPAPSVGGNSDEILSWIGYDARRIKDLRERSVVY
jgi:crotonobetainyl-CoA:carnitine CoA-transferase CaiB-like acyl-CoA transferase